MSFFPLYTSDRSFAPLFRLLEDYDSYSRDTQPSSLHAAHRQHEQQHQPVRSFNPKFDVRETQTTFELHGELPGLERANLEIEFTEPQTLVVRGRVERSYTTSTPHAGLAEDNKSADASDHTDAKKQKANGDRPASPHQATVEDYVEIDESEANQAKPTETPKTEVVKPVQEPAQVAQASQPQPQNKTPAEKYWVSERSIGRFSRTFNFPARVDQDAVIANLNNGILSIIVSKAKKHEARRIVIT